MDWSKAKTAIIVILLVLNILLAANLFINSKITEISNPDEETISVLKEMLGKSKIKIDAEIPKNKIRMKPLIVKYEEYLPKSINDRFYEGRGHIETDENISKIYDDESIITIINNRRFLYEKLEKNKNNSEEPDDPEIIAKQFLEENGFETDDLVLTNLSKRNGLYSVEFLKIYDDKPVETSYTTLLIDGKDVITMDRLWIEVIEKDIAAIEIEPAYKALFSLIENKEYEGETIDSIESCYYFDPEKQGILEDNTIAERGRAIPAWRIGFESGKSTIIDNY